MRHVLDVPSHSPIPGPALPGPFQVPDIADRSFLCADDVADFAVAGGVLTGSRRTESWHLDRTGHFTCGTRATMSDSLAAWALDPHRLIEAFIDGRPERTCSPLWVIVEERPSSGVERCDPPGEQDAEQYLRLRRQLEVAGITLLDAVFFDDRRHWWSMCELLTGSTAWSRRSAAA